MFFSGLGFRKIYPLAFLLSLALEIQQLLPQKSTIYVIFFNFKYHKYYYKEREKLFWTILLFFSDGSVKQRLAMYSFAIFKSVLPNF